VIPCVAEGVQILRPEEMELPFAPDVDPAGERVRRSVASVPPDLELPQGALAAQAAR
jgi:hypothetical protein